MAKNSYIDHLRQRLAAIETTLERERERLDTAPAEEKAQALSSLSQLQQQHRTVEERLKGAGLKHAESWSDAHAGWQEELDGIADSLQKFLTR